MRGCGVVVVIYYLSSGDLNGSPLSPEFSSENSSSEHVCLA
jgi:hypothetical protein